MTYRNRAAMVTSACLAIATFATACSSNSPEAGRPDTSAPPPTATSTSSEGSPTVPTPETAAPERPAAAGGLTLAAAEAFLDHYVALLNFTYASGDTQPLLTASDKGCIGCNGTADYLKKTNGKNGGLSGDYADHLVDVKELFRGSSGRIGGSMTVRSGNYTERTTPTAAPVQKKAHTETWQFTLSAADGNWVMYEIEVDE